MTNTPNYWNKAKKYLSKKDKVMKILIKKYNDKTLSSRKDIFYSLCKSIIGQQISVAAADAVFSKFKKKAKKINPSFVSKLSLSQIKSCGLSRQKAKGIKELAKKIIRKEFNPNYIKKLNDEDAIEYLNFLI